MLNIEIGKLRELEVKKHIQEYASFYNEGDYDWHIEYIEGKQGYCPQPCIEVFCYYGRELVERNAKELAKTLEAYGNEVCVDYEHYGRNGFSRIMIYVGQTTELFKVITLSKTLAKYGYKEYLELW